MGLLAIRNFVSVILLFSSSLLVCPKKYCYPLIQTNTKDKNINFLEIVVNSMFYSNIVFKSVLSEYGNLTVSIP